MDSNIWLYALIESQDKAKSARARQALQQDNLCLSTQVINEVCLNLIKKAGMAKEKLVYDVSLLEAWSGRLEHKLKLQEKFFH